MQTLMIQLVSLPTRSSDLRTLSVVRVRLLGVLGDAVLVV